MTDNVEPEQAFPYTPPSENLVKVYSHIFELREPLKPRLVKTTFDKVFAFLGYIYTIKRKGGLDRSMRGGTTVPETCPEAFALFQQCDGYDLNKPLHEEQRAMKKKSDGSDLNKTLHEENGR